LEKKLISPSLLIVLPVIRILATGNKPTEPIFRLAGEPGHTNMDFLELKGLIENHDIIMVGYRLAIRHIV